MFGCVGPFSSACVVCTNVLVGIRRWKQRKSISSFSHLGNFTHTTSTVPPTNITSYGVFTFTRTTSPAPRKANRAIIRLNYTFVSLSRFVVQLCISPDGGHVLRCCVLIVFYRLYCPPCCIEFLIILYNVCVCIEAVTPCDLQLI